MPEYDFSKPDTQKVFQQEVRKRMAPPLNMTRAQAEMIVAHLMWSRCWESLVK